MTEERAVYDVQPKGKGSGSFCIPKAALQALLNNNATAYEICTYLTLARFTDGSGVYSVANVAAVNRYTGANKTKGGPVDRAIERLKTFKATITRIVSNGHSGKHHKMVNETVSLGPILYSRDDWMKLTGEIPPDGPVERSKVLNILPDFNEPHVDRIWLGSGLVDGYGKFSKPLRDLKNAGDVAARLLLHCYLINAMEEWGGINPLFGPWRHYSQTSSDVIQGGGRLIRSKSEGDVGKLHEFITGEKNQSKGSSLYFSALTALTTMGFVYEVVVVLNKNGIEEKFSSGTEYLDIPPDAEVYYELDCRSLHGYKPKGEEGIAWATAKTAGELGRSVAEAGGVMDGTYAAIVPQGYGAMIIGIYRLRFRVSNPKNAGVKGAWAGIHERNKSALSFVNSIRSTHKLPEIKSPTETATEKYG